MATNLARFFTPSYYSPSYFPATASSDGTPVSGSVYRDRDAYAAVVTALSDTGEFAEVFFGTAPDQRAAGSDSVPAAVITPVGWAEFDDAEPVVIIRQVSYVLTLVVRDEDPLARCESLDRLSCVAQNALDGSNLESGCLPAYTKLRRGRFEWGSTHPEQSLVLDGEFTYLVPSLAGHNTRLL